MVYCILYMRVYVWNSNYCKSVGIYEKDQDSTLCHSVTVYLKLFMLL